MSDAILPPPRSSSGAPDGHRSDSSTSEYDHDTSLVTSSGSESKDDLSNKSENKADAKQKRKRTSTKDQAILEAEYKENPKPNKTARAVIVQKVNLNEKEVQIWFQNRRQINRRKSRPLLPHEVAAFGLGGMMALSSDPATGILPNSSQIIKALISNMDQGDSIGTEEGDMTRSQSPKLPDESPMVMEAAAAQRAQQSNEVVESILSTMRTFKSACAFENHGVDSTSSSMPENLGLSFSSTPGYLANRWNLANSSFSTPSSSQIAPVATPPIFSPSLPSSCPERIGVTVKSNLSPKVAKIRLSMSLDGKAELVESLSSPARETPPRPSSSGAVFPQDRRSLQRSQSAFSFSHSSHNSPSTGPAPFVPQLQTGRSRDARTWEFACDPDARDELTTQAENESTGSAVAAISLLRSTSHTALKSNNNKRNAPSGKQDAFANVKKPKLGRAQSSVARLQSTGKSTSKVNRPSKGGQGLMRSPSGDSDKENRLPGEEGSHARRRPLPSARTERDLNSKNVLGDNLKIMADVGNFGGSKSRRRKGANLEPKVFEDQEREGGEEVEKFMRGDVSPSKKGDLDCIHGLLSLSQGNWQ